MTRWWYLCTLWGLLWTVSPPAVAEASAAEERPLDITEPRSPASEGDISRLRVATLVTHDLAQLRRFYVDSLGLSLRGPIDLSQPTRAAQRRLWGLPDDLGYDLYHLHRPSVPGTIEVRVLVLDRETPAIHDRWDARQPGPFSLGFPTSELGGWDAELRAAGHSANNPMSVYRVPRSDGTSYAIEETIWHAPDFVHSVTIARRDGVPPLGPFGAGGRGGPVYSAQSIVDSETELAFYTDVLGFRMRSDRQWKSHGSTGALAVPDGTEFRFSILYAPGATYGHLLFIDFRDDALPATGVAPRPPNRGLAAWTFAVRDLDAMAGRLRAAGHEPTAGPLAIDSPILGPIRALTVEAPNGFLIELVEPRSEQLAVGPELSPQEIVTRAVAAAGGETWRRPTTLQLRGQADFFPDGEATRRIHLAPYEMDRVFPGASTAAHRANGKLRLEIHHGEELFLRSLGDGERFHNELGPAARPFARRFAAESNFGFGILRFADGDGFTLRRAADDSVDGFPCYFIDVIDPGGAHTLFGVDRERFFIRFVGFETESGFHHRVYSDFAWVDPGRSFLQPHRVRIFNEGRKWFDIRWQSVDVGRSLDPELFRIEAAARLGDGPDASEHRPGRSGSGEPRRQGGRTE